MIRRLECYICTNDNTQLSQPSETALSSCTNVVPKWNNRHRDTDTEHFLKDRTKMTFLSPPPKNVSAKLSYIVKIPSIYGFKPVFPPQFKMQSGLWITPTVKIESGSRIWFPVNLTWVSVHFRIDDKVERLVPSNSTTTKRSKFSRNYRT